MEPAWEKICGRKFALTSRTISQPNGGTRKITGLKFQLSTYKDPTGRTLPCYTITEVAMMLNTQISQIFLDDHGFTRMIFVQQKCVCPADLADLAELVFGF